MPDPSNNEIVESLVTPPRRYDQIEFLFFTLVGRLQGQADSGSRTARAHLLWLHHKAAGFPTANPPDSLDS